VPPGDAPIPLEPMPAIEADLACAMCGYNLKGLSPDGACPECGRAIGETLNHGLSHADPAWLRRQAGAVPFLAALCLLNYPPQVYGWMEQLSYALRLTAAAVNIWACWRLASVEPGKSPDEDGTARRGLLLAPLVTAATAAWNVPGGSVLEGRFLAYFVVLIANNYLALWHVRRLARRASDRSLDLHARAMFWVFCPLQLPALILYFARPTDYETALMAFSVVFGYVSQVVLFATLILLGRVQETLRAAAAGRERR
jgi:hypothetical protein